MAAAASMPFRFPSIFQPLADDEWDTAGLQTRQRVRTAAGDPGTIVGFYRTSNPTALVALDAGTTCEFSLGDLIAV
jgi:hypothetical protein